MCYARHAGRGSPHRTRPQQRRLSRITAFIVKSIKLMLVVSARPPPHPLTPPPSFSLAHVPSRCVWSQPAIFLLPAGGRPVCLSAELRKHAGTDTYLYRHGYSHMNTLQNGFPQRMRSIISQRNQYGVQQQLIPPLCSQCTQST